MLLDLLYEAIDKYVPRISLTSNKFSHKITLSSSTNSKIRQKYNYGNYIFRQATPMFITNIVKLVTKYVFLRDSLSKILKKIFVIILKIILKSFRSILTTKEKPT